MNRLNKIKKMKNINIMYVILGVLFAFIVINFSAHVIRTIEFNKEYYNVIANEESTSVQLYESTSAPWNKENALVENVTNGATYSFYFKNKESYIIDDWTLRVDIEDECYLNQAWNGTVEIHQNVSSGNEVIQTLDLHNLKALDYDNIILEYYGTGNDFFMIHLYEGDYIIYNPSKLTEVHEYPLSGNDAIATVGMIFYYNTSFEINSYNVTYSFGKSISSGTPFVVSAVLTGIWILLLSITLSWIFANKRLKKEMALQDAMLNETMGLITRFVDAKDTYTNGHSSRVALYSKMLAEKLDMPKEQQKYAYYVAILHDIGKCYVPDEILKKPSNLTDEEYKIIQRHTTKGAEMLKSVKSLNGISDGAHYHHERFDGKGYPEGLKGEEIPYIARIICVADAFDAMTSSRCYRKPLSKETVLSELEKDKGHQFDPKIADAMIELIKEDRINIDAWKEDKK